MMTQDAPRPRALWCPGVEYPVSTNVWRARIDGVAREVRRVHCVGIGGSGVGALAALLVGRGLAVTGSDARDGPALDAAAAAGAAVFVGHASGHVHPGLDLVIHTAAVGEAHPELAAARRLGIPTLKYARALGLLMEDRVGVAVAGTHGKTTTTAMVAWVLDQAGRDPSFVIGGRYPPLGGASRAGTGPELVAEACEFDRSFLQLRPRHAIVTNVEADHLDYYRDLEEIAEAFGEFLRRLPASGSAAVHAGDPVALATARAASAATGAALDPYALEGTSSEARWTVRAASGRPGSPFQLLLDGVTYLETALRVPGRHNLLNACAATSVAHRLGVPPAATAQALAAFTGVERRFQVVHDDAQATVVDDYAHHPTEIAAVLESARDRYAGRRIWAVFQPHQHSRTRQLLDAFARILARADLTLVPDIYAARDPESERRAVGSPDLVDRIRARGGDARYMASLQDVVRFVESNRRDGDVIITMGAGDVHRVATQLVRDLGAGRAA
ncbi:MAG: UDP-N-acetylmuramate--L-alanine ligase [Planctomycetes bacterium]|nr:UDP-N-acetylmuramate--L-alanine ligase [Planctomycetota bacterium]